MSNSSKFALVWAALTPVLLLAPPVAFELRPVIAIAVYEVAILVAAWKWLKG